MIPVEIVVTGNELLQGDVLDTNTNWVCRRITRFGGRVERAVMVRDDMEAIVREVRSCLDRAAGLIITIGGMGPTQDDVTIAAVAAATHRPLSLHPDALAIVRRQYERFAREGAVDDPTITPAREKMALLPAGATPLDNPVGAAPGVLLETDSSVIVCLPGVPAELKGIFEGALQPVLQRLFGDSVFLEKLATVNCKDESVLAPVLKAVAERHPDVYLKSRAQRFGADVRFRVTLSTTGPSRETAERRITAATEDFQRALSAIGVSIDAIEEL
ncbi:MAG: molybdopterin-binding protein [Roseiflexus sp.]|nr:molybdopterin-binding protein [Roseiflexus sp.]MCS7290510.1 molybdopterin-binding protein [Roseiflexus sp.]MDW8148349.1 molybdopterin-binding protein [Roseiflexaceae bacterium]MDW8232283.1 molybdopterin-binding protein [Roseiflexaceae bacterium]